MNWRRKKAASAPGARLGGNPDPDAKAALQRLLFGGAEAARRG
jgi:hypothetical protein